jgi:hypothetical protein
MWAHYGKNGTGFALQFDAEDVKKKTESLNEVAMKLATKVYEEAAKAQQTEETSVDEDSDDDDDMKSKKDKKKKDKKSKKDDIEEASYEEK